jgi:SagB-type dehydrogenase family enzyme
MREAVEEERYKEIVRYHEETKHHYGRYAKSLGYMDWESQPNPFRFYEGGEPVPLPLLKEDPPGDYMRLYRSQSIHPAPLNVVSIAGFLELSLGLSAWKVSGRARWSLRINPSSGNLHPTEAHLLLPDTDGVKGGAYHYNALNHCLEPRADIPEALWKRIVRHFGVEGFFVGLSSIFWRESWKYGERAFRYCQHDTGHAVASLSISAHLYGWKLAYLNALSDDDIDHILGFDRAKWEELEREDPELLCFVHRRDHGDTRKDLPEDVLSGFSSLAFHGKPNVLSQRRYPWDIIYETASLTRKPRTAERRLALGSRPFLERSTSPLRAAEIIRKRRSAVDFEPGSSLSRDQFFTILDKTIPRDGSPPFDVELIESSLDLLIFLHHVKGLDSGLYLFFRNEDHRKEIESMCSRDLLWQRTEGELPLYLLKKGDFRHEAFIVSCEQEIAGLGAFSLGMIARFAETIKSAPYRYRHLFWESGMIGQVLYLEAEANGARGTGMGCYFDDPVHELIGLKGNAYQSLYHFAVGQPVEDRRISTHPPYDHIAR